MTKALRAAALLLAAMPALAAAVAPLHLWWGQLAIGDGFAYPLIAWNIVHGVGQTYDGIIPTNGFHPLWMLLHQPLQLGAAAPMERVWAVKILVAATTVGAVGAWGRVIQRVASDEWAGLVMAAWLGASGWTLYVLFSGIEAPLVVLIDGPGRARGLAHAGSAITRERRAAGSDMGLCCGLERASPPSPDSGRGNGNGYGYGYESLRLFLDISHAAGAAAPRAIKQRGAFRYQVPAAHPRDLRRGGLRPTNVTRSGRGPWCAAC